MVNGGGVKTGIEVIADNFSLLLILTTDRCSTR